MGSHSKIAFDFDDVLFPFVRRFWELCKQHYQCGVEDYESIQMPYFDQILDCHVEQAQQVYENFRRNEDLWQKFHDIEPASEILEALQKLKQAGKQLEIVTARSHDIREITEECVARIFPGIFDQIHFCNTYGTTGDKYTKASICLQHNLTILIDDSLGNIENVEAHGIIGIPFGKHVWSQRHDTITEWSELIEKLLSL